MKGKNLAVLLLLPVTLLLAPSAIAWGPNGHRAVGLIAERNLKEDVRRQVRDILNGESLAAVSNWPDFIRAFAQWNCAAPFHYSTIRPGADYWDQGVPSEGDALGAIAHYFQILKDTSAEPASRTDALRFLTHIVGDLHQPLHAGLGCDRGGNDVVVKWMGEESRLHSVWDSAILESLHLGYSEYVNLLVEPSAAERARIQAGSPLDWARESQDLLAEVYRCSTGQDRCPCLCGNCGDGYSVFGGCLQQACRLVAAPVTLGWEYQSRAEPIVARRIQEAGLRLAAVLNAALGGEGPSPAFTWFLQQVAEGSNWDAAFKNCPAG